MDYHSLLLLKNTLLLSTATCVLSLPPGIVLAGLFFRTDLPGRRFAWAALLVMLFVPLYLQAAAWQAGFGLQGWLTATTDWPPLLEGWRGAIAIHVFAAIPWVTGIVGLGMLRIERELEEQALLDGGALQVFFRVTLRGSLPTIGLAALWVAVTTAGEMTVTDFFSIRTYAEEVYTQIALGQEPGVPPPSLMGGIVLTALLIVGGWRLASDALRRPLSVQQSLCFSLRHWKGLATTLVVGTLLLIVGVPLGNLLYKAGVMVTASESGLTRSFSPGKAAAIVAQSPLHYQREFGWTLLIGVLAALAAVVVGLAIAWWSRDEKKRVRSWIGKILMAGLFATPGPILGLLIIHLLNQPKIPLLVYLYDHSILAPWLALFLRSLPIATLVLWCALRFLPPELLDAAKVDGAGRWGQFVHVGVPWCRPALAVAFCAALAVAWGDLAASILVVPPGVMTLAIQIFSLLHYGVEDQVAGICLAWIGCFGVLAVLPRLALQQWKKRNADLR